MSAANPTFDLSPIAIAAAPPKAAVQLVPGVPTQDERLVQAILDGEEGAFDELHSLYATRLYRFAVKRLGDATEAEDVVQDTFLEVHRCLPSWEGRSRLLTWMFGIAHHQICRRFRKQTPAALPIEELELAHVDSDESSVESRIDAGRVLRVCATALEDEIAEPHREIFDLFYGGQQGIKGISEALGKSNQAVKISLFRTRRAMSARLESEGLELTA